MVGDMGTIPSYVALTTLTGQIHTDELAGVAAALQTQVTRDFAPTWGATAVIAAVSFESIPAGYIPVIVQDTLQAHGANGFHRTHTDDSPYILVPYGPNWPLAASHELLRMLTDPAGSARRPGPSRMSGQGTVEYLIDVCAPCQDANAAYAIDGVAVSDFCTPRFFGEAGSACSFTGSVRDPFDPAPGGNVTWLADDGLLYQARTDLRGRVGVHGGFTPAGRGRMLLRELIDLLTPDRLPRLANAPRTPRILESEKSARRSRFTNLTRFREDISWRFGNVSPTDAEVEPHYETARLRTYAFGAARSGQQAESADEETTLRTAS
jgi:hypothetical protein